MLDHHLLVFVTVAEKKNFSRAAEALNLSQPAISLQVQTLEDYYGARLFERNNKRVDLTQAGEALYPIAKQILELHEAAVRSVNDLTGLVSGRLTIGSSLTIGEFILPRLIADYSREFPQVEVSIRIANTEDIADLASAGQLDVALVEGPFRAARLTVTPFAQDDLVLIVPAGHRLASKSEAAPDELKGETFILREIGSGTRHAMEEQMRKSGIETQRIVEMGSNGAIKEAVEAGLGISFISRWSIRKELALGSLAYLHVPPSTNRAFSLALPDGRFRPRAVKEFIRVVQESMERIDRDLHRHLTQPIGP